MVAAASNRTIWVSADALSGCVEVARDAGFDVRPYLARHGIDCNLIEHARGLLSYAAISACLEDIARSQSCPDFGFQLGCRQAPLQFGIISQILQFAPTVGDAIRIFLRYRDLYSQSSHWDLQIEGDIARLKRQELGTDSRTGTQIPILSVTRGVAAIRSLMHRAWAPIGVYFAHDDVAFSSAMKRHFRAPVFFNCQFDEIAFEAADLLQPIPTGNAEILAALTDHFDRLFPELNRQGPMSAQVQKHLRMGVETGGATLADVAAHFGLHPRSLQRALSAEDTSFRALERETRMVLARQMVETSRSQLADVATLAGYRHISSFSRAFKRSQGQSPRQHRATGKAQ
jgi:AraC-like DNA-binding protein